MWFQLSHGCIELTTHGVTRAKRLLGFPQRRKWFGKSLAKTIVLAAGKSTRLDGECKLLVEADGKPVHKWHSDAWGEKIDALIQPEHLDPLLAAGWEGLAIGLDVGGGPARALLEYMDIVQEQGRITVVYADSLVKSRIDTPGDWVGVSVAPGRVWDYWNGFDWVRGIPTVKVCCGIYQFEDGALLLDILRGIEYPDESEVGMTTVLRRYDHKRRLERLLIKDWQDAGDWDALKRVKQ